MYRETRLQTIQSYTYTNLNGFHPLWNNRALIDSLDLFSTKKIPFEIKESLHEGNRYKEGRQIETDRRIEKKCQTIHFSTLECDVFNTSDTKWIDEKW